MITYDRYFQHVIIARVNGEDAVDLADLIGRMEVHEDERRATKVTMTLVVENDGVDFEGTIIEDERCQPGSVWELRWGYLDNLSDLLTVKVQYFEPEFPESGLPVVKLYLTDRQVTANRDSASRNWGRQQSSDIAIAIAERYGMAANVEESGDQRQRAYVQPATEPDIQFLQRLATPIRFLCYVENNTLHYHRADWETPAVAELLYYAGDPYSVLQSFRPIVKENIARSSRTTGGESNEDGGDQPALGSYYEVDLRHQVVAKREEQARNIPTVEEESSLRRRRAAAEQRRMLEAVREASAVCLGQPNLRRNTNVTIGGVGRDLSGTWHVIESTHTLDDKGYRTEIKLKKGASVTATRPTTASDEVERAPTYNVNLRDQSVEKRGVTASGDVIVQRVSGRDDS